MPRRRSCRRPIRRRGHSVGGFLYYIPGHDRQLITAAEFSEAGLGHALLAGKPTGLVTAKGPDGGKGAYCIVPAPAAPGAAPAQGLLFRHGEAAWRRGPGGKFWLGLIESDKPGPADLARQRLISGEEIELADGNRWTIPICFSIVRGSTLPKRIVLGEDGTTWETRELERFLPLCADAAKVWQLYRQSGQEQSGTDQSGNPPADGEADKQRVTIDLQEGMRIAVAAIAVNYRVSALEVDALGLIDSERVWEILKAMIDGFNLERVAIALAAKKNSSIPDTSPISDGAMGS